MPCSRRADIERSLTHENVNSHRADALRQYFAGQPDALLASLFGSAATGREIAESAVDVAV